MSVHCYAQRLLNPFRGALHVIEYKSAEAVTMDGVHWDIYVRNDELLSGLEDAGYVQTSDIRYGSWSIENGLKRGAIFPSEDFKRMEHYGAILFQHLQMRHTDLPFPFHDIYELWLLDGKLQPLALLDSAVKPERLHKDKPLPWRAGNICRQTFLPDFYSQSSETQGTPLPASECIEQHIARQAGESLTAQWFRRLPDGSGEALAGTSLPGCVENRVLDKSAFPKFFITDIHHDKNITRLIQSYFTWLSPWLLLLPHLTQDERAIMENQASHNARHVNTLHRLYPEVLNESFIKTARVEALMRSKQQSAEEVEDVMSTFYIEMGPTSG